MRPARIWDNPLMSGQPQALHPLTANDRNLRCAGPDEHYDGRAGPAWEVADNQALHLVLVAGDELVEAVDWLAQISAFANVAWRLEEQRVLAEEEVERSTGRAAASITVWQCLATIVSGSASCDSFRSSSSRICRIASLSAALILALLPLRRPPRDRSLPSREASRAWSTSAQSHIQPGHLHAAVGGAWDCLILRHCSTRLPRIASRLIGILLVIKMQVTMAKLSLKSWSFAKKCSCSLNSRLASKMTLENFGKFILSVKEIESNRRKPSPYFKKDIRNCKIIWRFGHLSGCKRFIALNDAMNSMSASSWERLSSKYSSGWQLSSSPWCFAQNHHNHSFPLNQRKCCIHLESIANKCMHLVAFRKYYSELTFEVTSIRLNMKIFANY